MSTLHLAFLGSIGTPELIVIFIIVLLIFGPAALPKLARSLGSSIREFKDATTKMTDSVMKEAEEKENQESKRVEGSQQQSSSGPVPSESQQREPAEKT